VMRLIWEPTNFRVSSYSSACLKTKGSPIEIKSSFKNSGNFILRPTLSMHSCILISLKSDLDTLEISTSPVFPMIKYGFLPEMKSRKRLKPS